MIVHDLDLVGVAVLPDEADPPLIIDADAVLAAASTLERLEPVARRDAQVLERGGSIERRELRLSALGNGWGATLWERARGIPLPCACRRNS